MKQKQMQIKLISEMEKIQNNHSHFLRKSVTIIQNSVMLKFSKNSFNNMHKKESVREKIFLFHFNETAFVVDFKCS